MKNVNLYRIFAVLFIAVSFSSCVEDGDYTVPTLGADKEYTNLKSLSEIAEMYNGSLIDFDEFLTASGISDINTYGYVVSNDRGGNYYKTLIIQDKPVNPTIGIEVRIDDTNLNARYNVGRKIYIKLKGLAFNKRFDTYQIGIKNTRGNGVDRIGVNDYINFIDRSSELVEIVPTVLTIDELTNSNINTLVRLDNMQTANLGETFADPNSTRSINRLLKNCATEETVIMRTSGYASFKSLEIPQKKGSVTAILNKYRNDYQLFVRDLNDFDFKQDRCQALFEEQFESYDRDETNFTGWFNNNVNGGNTLFKIGEFNGNKYPQIRAFRSGESPLEAWLITPAINLDDSSNEILSFDTKTGYNNGMALSVMYSTDFDGANISSATWQPLSATIAGPPASGNWSDWINSGDIDLSGINGNIYIAFKYEGASDGVTSTYQIDNIVVKAQ